MKTISPDKRAVLVVDDDADARDALASVLDDEGYQIGSGRKRATSPRAS